MTASKQLSLVQSMDPDLVLPVRDAAGRLFDPATAEWVVSAQRAGADVSLFGFVYVAGHLVGVKDQVGTSATFAWPAAIAPAVTAPGHAPEVASTIPVPRRWIRSAFEELRVPTLVWGEL